MPRSVANLLTQFVENQTAATQNGLPLALLTHPDFVDAPVSFFSNRGDFDRVADACEVTGLSREEAWEIYSVALEQFGDNADLNETSNAEVMNNLLELSRPYIQAGAEQVQEQLQTQEVEPELAPEFEQAADMGLDAPQEPAQNVTLEDLLQGGMLSRGTQNIPQPQERTAPDEAESSEQVEQQGVERGQSWLEEQHHAAIANQMHRIADTAAVASEQINANPQALTAEQLAEIVRVRAHTLRGAGPESVTSALIDPGYAQAPLSELDSLEAVAAAMRHPQSAEAINMAWEVTQLAQAHVTPLSEMEEMMGVQRTGQDAFNAAQQEVDAELYTQAVAANTAAQFDINASALSLGINAQALQEAAAQEASQAPAEQQTQTSEQAAPEQSVPAQDAFALTEEQRHVMATEAAERVTTGQPLDDDQLANLFDMQPADQFVRQANVGWFVQQYLGVSRNRIHVSLAQAAWKAMDDQDRLTSYANPRMLHEVFGEVFVKRQLAQARDNYDLPIDTTLERDIQGNWILTAGEGDNALVVTAETLDAAAQQMVEELAPSVAAQVTQTAEPEQPELVEEQPQAEAAPAEEAATEPEAEPEPEPEPEPVDDVPAETEAQPIPEPDAAPELSADESGASTWLTEEQKSILVPYLENLEAAIQSVAPLMERGAEELTQDEAQHVLTTIREALESQHGKLAPELHYLAHGNAFGFALGDISQQSAEANIEHYFQADPLGYEVSIEPLEDPAEQERARAFTAGVAQAFWSFENYSDEDLEGGAWDRDVQWLFSSSLHEADSGLAENYSKAFTMYSSASSRLREIALEAAGINQENNPAPGESRVIGDLIREAMERERVEEEQAPASSAVEQNAPTVTPTATLTAEPIQQADLTGAQGEQANQAANPILVIDTNQQLTNQSIGQMASRAFAAHSANGWQKGKSLPFVIRTRSGRMLQFAITPNDARLGNSGRTGRQLNVWHLGRKSVLNGHAPSLTRFDWTFKVDGTHVSNTFNSLFLDRQLAVRMNTSLAEVGYPQYTEEMITKPEKYLTEDWYNLVEGNLVGIDDYAKQANNPAFVPGPGPQGFAQITEGLVTLAQEEEQATTQATQEEAEVEAEVAQVADTPEAAPEAEQDQEQIAEVEEQVAADADLEDEVATAAAEQPEPEPEVLADLDTEIVAGAEVDEEAPGVTSLSRLSLADMTELPHIGTPALHAALVNEMTAAVKRVEDAMEAHGVDDPIELTRLAVAIPEAGADLSVYVSRKNIANALIKAIEDANYSRFERLYGELLPGTTEHLKQNIAEQLEKYESLVDERLEALLESGEFDRELGREPKTMEELFGAQIWHEGEAVEVSDYEAKVERLLAAGWASMLAENRDLSVPNSDDHDAFYNQAYNDAYFLLTEANYEAVLVHGGEQMALGDGVEVNFPADGIWVRHTYSSRDNAEITNMRTWYHFPVADANSQDSQDQLSFTVYKDLEGNGQLTLESEHGAALNIDRPMQGWLVNQYMGEINTRVDLLDAYGGLEDANEEILEGYVGPLAPNTKGQMVHVDEIGRYIDITPEGEGGLFDAEPVFARPDALVDGDGAEVSLAKTPFETKIEPEAQRRYVNRLNRRPEHEISETLPTAASGEEPYFVSLDGISEPTARIPGDSLQLGEDETLVSSQVVIGTASFTRNERSQLGLGDRGTVQAWRVSLVERGVDSYIVVEAETSLIQPRGEDYLEGIFTRLSSGAGIELLGEKVPAVRELARELLNENNEALLEEQVVKDAPEVTEAPEIYVNSTTPQAFFGGEAEFNSVVEREAGLASMERWGVNGLPQDWDVLSSEEQNEIIQRSEALNEQVTAYREQLEANIALEQAQTTLEGDLDGEAWEMPMVDWTLQEIEKSRNYSTYLDNPTLHQQKIDSLSKVWEKKLMDRAKVGPISVATLDDILDREGQHGLDRFQGEFALGVEGYSTPLMRQLGGFTENGEIAYPVRTMTISSSNEELDGKVFTIPQAWDGRLAYEPIDGKEGHYQVSALLPSGESLPVSIFEDGRGRYEEAQELMRSLASERLQELYPDVFEANEELLDARHALLTQAGEHVEARTELANNVFGMDQRSQMLADRFGIKRAEAVTICREMLGRTPEAMDNDTVTAVLGEYDGLADRAASALALAYGDQPAPTAAEQVEQPEAVADEAAAVEAEELGEEAVEAEQPELVEEQQPQAEEAPAEEVGDEPEQEAEAELEPVAVDQLSVAEAIELLGLNVSEEQLTVFAGMTTAQAEALSGVQVRVADTAPTEDYPSAQALNESTTLIMNAARPLVGDSVFEGAFMRGNRYAQINLSQPMLGNMDVALDMIKTNVELDAGLPIVMDADTIAALAFVAMEDKRRAMYLEEQIAVNSGEAGPDVVEMLLRRDRNYQMADFVSSVNELRTALGIEPLQFAEAVQGAEEAVAEAVEPEQVDTAPEQLQAEEAPAVESTVEEPEVVEQEAQAEQPEETPAPADNEALREIVRDVERVFGNVGSQQEQLDFTAAIAGRLAEEDRWVAQAQNNTLANAMFGGIPGRVNEELVNSINSGDDLESGVAALAVSVLGSENKTAAFQQTVIQLLANPELLEQLRNVQAEQLVSAESETAGADTQGESVRQWRGATREDLIQAEQWAATPHLPAMVQAVINCEDSKGFDRDNLETSMAALKMVSKGWGAFDLSRRVWEVREAAATLGIEEDELIKLHRLGKPDSYFTSVDLVSAAWAVLEKAGVPHTSLILEPTAGAGAYIIGAPVGYQNNANFLAVEKCPIQARFAQALAPDARVVNGSLEETPLPRNFGAAVGNVPFGSTRLSCAKNGDKTLIHDYCIRRALESLEPGGVAVLQVTSGFLDSLDDKIRKQIMEESDLLGGVRMPDNMYAEAGATVTVDYLIFQKRMPGVAPSYDWSGTQEIEKEDPDTGEVSTYRVNNYFADNPEKIIGELAYRSSQFGPRQTVVQRELDREQVIAKVTEEMLSAIEAGQYQLAREQVAQVPSGSQRQQAGNRPEPQVAAGDWGDGAVVSELPAEGLQVAQIIQDGDKFWQVTDFTDTFNDDGSFAGSVAVVAPFEITGRGSERKLTILHDYMPLRDAALALVEAQRNPDDEALEAAQAHALELYEAFTDKHGPVNKAYNYRIYSDDPASAEVVGLEKYDFKEKVVLGVADSLSKRVITPVDQTVSYSTPEEAYYASIDQKQGVDLDFMVENSDLTREELLEALLNNKIFYNPVSQDFEPDYKYLSGNVVVKLDIAREAAKEDHSMLGNVEALERVKPKELLFEQIPENVGAPWFPPEVVTEWVNGITSGVWSDKDFKAQYNPVVQTWTVETSADFRKRNQHLFYTEMGHNQNHQFHHLLAHVLNGSLPTVSTTGPDGKPVTDDTETQKARLKMESVKQRFTTWIASTEWARDKVTETYNTKVNVVSTFKGDTGPVEYPGLNDAFTPMDHQREAQGLIARGDNCTIAICAGGGKTLVMLSAAMKARASRGAAARPMVAVPNHLIGQTLSQAKMLYPGSKVLAVSSEDLKGSNRAKFAAQMKNNDYDIVIVTHSLLDRMRADDDVRFDSIDSRIGKAEDLLVRTDDKKEQKLLASHIKGLHSERVKLAEVMERERRDGTVIHLGDSVNMLMVDEAHLRTNIGTDSSLQVLGMGDRNGSAGGRNLYDLVGQMQKNNGGEAKGVVLFTGTPIKNTADEAAMLLFLMRDPVFEAAGIETVQEFVRSYGLVTQQMEILSEGNQIDARWRLTGIHSSFMQYLHNKLYAKTADELNLPTPDAEHISQIGKPNLLQQVFQNHLAFRATAIRDGEKDESEEITNMLQITSLGRMAAIDMRLVDDRISGPLAGERVNEVAENVLEIYKESEETKGTQLIFLDYGTWKGPNDEGVYGKIRDTLIERGIKPEEIGIVHQAKNDKEVEAMQAALRSGELRVLIGSTEKMATGMNVQNKGVAIHMMSLPWRPDQIQQAIARFVRMDNENEQVKCLTYGLEGSTEGKVATANSVKANFIAEMLAAKDLNPEEFYNIAIKTGPDYAQIMADLVGEPKIKELHEVTAEYDNLVLQKSMWEQDKKKTIQRKLDTEADIVKAGEVKQLWSDVQESLPHGTEQGVTIKGAVTGTVNGKVVTFQEGDTTWLPAATAKEERESATAATGLAKNDPRKHVTAQGVLQQAFEDCSYGMRKLNGEEAGGAQRRGMYTSRYSDAEQDMGVSVGGVKYTMQSSAIRSDEKRVVGKFNETELPQVSRSFSISNGSARGLLNHVVQPYDAAGRKEKAESVRQELQSSLARIPDVQDVWPHEAQLAEVAERKAELDEWAETTDHTQRFRDRVDYWPHYEAALQNGTAPQTEEELKDWMLELAHDLGDDSVQSYFMQENNGSQQDMSGTLADIEEAEENESQAEDAFDSMRNHPAALPSL